MSYSLPRLFTDDLVIRRLKTIDGYKMGYQATSTAEGRIEDMDPQQANLGGYLVGQTFMGWMSDLETVAPEVGDQITDQNGRIYEVKDVNLRNIGINQHFELILERYNPKEREA